MLTLKFIEHKDELDISNKKSIREDSKLVEILLKDRTTRKNIIWATDSYIAFGKGFAPKDNIQIKSIRNGISDLIKPRSEKVKYEQENRTRDSAEVFTPTWIIKKQNDLLDNDLKNLPLLEYVNIKWLEVACGEAPYIASRYDTVTGEAIEIKSRVGFLDRKIQRVSKEENDPQEWCVLVEKAYKSTFGYEFQGDSLFLARENLLNTYIDYYFNKFKIYPQKDDLKKIAKIVSYNIFQMDGLNYNVPLSEEVEVRKLAVQLSLFSENKKAETFEVKKEGINVKIKNWSNNRLTEFNSFLERNDSNMKFDVVIGNPPYQQDDGNARGKSSPIYNKFVKSAISLNANKVLMITPSRWFSGGKGLNNFRKKMLTSNKLSFLVDYPDASEVFPNVSIKGGVSYFIYDKNHNGQCSVTTVDSGESNTMLRPLLEEGLNFYIRFNESVPVVRKVMSSKFESFSKIISPRKPFGIPSTFKDYLDTGGKDKVIIYGNSIKAFARKSEVTSNIELIDKVKVFISFAYGAGETYPHQIINKPFLGEIGSCSTETYLAVGPFDSEKEAENCIKYMKTKFFRFMVLQKKISQNATRMVYEYVPLLELSSNEDINWDKSIHNINQQLYKKYKLNEEEINFIENKIREME